MKFKKLNSQKVVNVAITDYVIDWNHKVSGPQKLVKDFLKPYWKADCILEEFRIPGSKLRIDLFNISKHIVLEVSPIQHQEFNEFFHKTRAGFLQALKRDMDKRKWAEDNEFTFIELYEDDLSNLTVKWFAAKGITL